MGELAKALVEAGLPPMAAELIARAIEEVRALARRALDELDEHVALGHDV